MTKVTVQRHSLINVSEEFFHMIFVSGDIFYELCSAALEACCTPTPESSVFPFPPDQPSRNGMNCVMAEKQHLTLGNNVWPLLLTIHWHGLKTFGLKE